MTRTVCDFEYRQCRGLAWYDVMCNRDASGRQSHKMKSIPHSISCVFLMVWTIILFSCQTKDATPGPTEPAKMIVEDTTHVDGIILTPRVFAKQILSQGSIEAASKVDLALPGESAMIQSITVSIGQHVRQGDLLATLDARALEHEYRGVLLELEQKELQIEGKLISQGFTQADSLNVPQGLLLNLHREAGIPILQHRLTKLEREINAYQIKAPISGVIAELEAKAYNLSGNFKKLCTIIDPHSFQVVFPVLESELTSAQKGMKVTLSPVHNPKHQISARISGINPSVDEYGMVHCHAKVGQSQNLLEGMKVDIKMEEHISDQLVLPKSAVVDRQNRYVTFVLLDGLAHWIYVQVIHENQDYYTIDDSGPMIGDTVIVSNNFDLAHLEPVLLDSLIQASDK